MNHCGVPVHTSSREGTLLAAARVGEERRARADVGELILERVPHRQADVAKGGAHLEGHVAETGLVTDVSRTCRGRCPAVSRERDDGFVCQSKPYPYLEERVEGGAGSAVRHLRVGGEDDEPAAEMGPR